MYHSNNDDKNKEVPALKSIIIIIIIFKKKIENCNHTYALKSVIFWLNNLNEIMEN